MLSKATKFTDKVTKTKRGKSINSNLPLLKYRSNTNYSMIICTLAFDPNSLLSTPSTSLG